MGDWSQLNALYSSRLIVTIVVTLSGIHFSTLARAEEQYCSTSRYISEHEALHHERLAGNFRYLGQEKIRDVHDRFALTPRLQAHDLADGIDVSPLLAIPVSFLGSDPIGGTLPEAVFCLLEPGDLALITDGEEVRQLLLDDVSADGRIRFLGLGNEGLAAARLLKVEPEREPSGGLSLDSTWALLKKRLGGLVLI